jgi:osmotically-inducible protein OsmY
MFRGLVKVVLVGAVLIAAAFFVFGYWTGGSFRSNAPATQTQRPAIDTSAARERGAQIGEQAARAVATAGESLEAGSLTAKIKAKMVLDDFVKARAIDVTTAGSIVTLSGTVQSTKERERAVQLARETEGVTQVVDHLTVRQP